MSNLGIRYKIADDVWTLCVFDDIYGTTRRMIHFPGNIPRKQAPCFVNIVESTPPERMPPMKKLEFVFNGEKITGWVNLDWIDLKIEDDAFDGRFNQPLE